MKLKKEFSALIIILLPFLYLAYIWNTLPEKVPMHWNTSGEIDRYGNKINLIWIPILLPLLIYVILLIAPKIDPKKKINKMGNKYANFRLILTSIMSILALYIIHSSKEQSLTNLNMLYLINGLLYVVLGNYFKIIKHNYFIGIRTPWTLENEAVWIATHQLGGKLFFVGGLIIITTSLLLSASLMNIVFLTITAIIVIVSIAYSYFKFKQLKQ